MVNNFWLGSNEICIVCRDGRHHVLEEYENWESIFTGSYEDCLEYCEQREVDYKESTLI